MIYGLQRESSRSRGQEIILLPSFVKGSLYGTLEMMAVQAMGMKSALLMVSKHFL